MTFQLSSSPGKQFYAATIARIQAQLKASRAKLYQVFESIRKVKLEIAQQKKTVRSFIGLMYQRTKYDGKIIALGIDIANFKREIDTEKLKLNPSQDYIATRQNKIKQAKFKIKQLEAQSDVITKKMAAPLAKVDDLTKPLNALDAQRKKIVVEINQLKKELKKVQEHQQAATNKAKGKKSCSSRLYSPSTSPSSSPQRTPTSSLSSSPTSSPLRTPQRTPNSSPQSTPASSANSSPVSSREPSPSPSRNSSPRRGATSSASLSRTSSQPIPIPRPGK